MIAAGFVWLAAGMAHGHGRGGGVGWTTSRGDAQRAAWVKTDNYITVDSAPKMKLEWKRKFDNALSSVKLADFGRGHIRSDAECGARHHRRKFE